MLGACSGHAGLQKAGVFVNALEHRGEESEEANVLVRRLSWLEKIQAIDFRRVSDH
jgi:hypothetical protein